jgi:hypothetical protein
MEENSFNRENYMDSTFHENSKNDEDDDSHILVHGVDYTDDIYESIKKGEFQEAIRILNSFIRNGRKEKSVYSVIS